MGHVAPRLVLVTDAASGVGFEIAEQLADDHEYEVLLAAASERDAREAARRLWDHGIDGVHPRVLDAASDATVERLRASVSREFGRIDVLVTAHAGVARAFASVLAPQGRVVDVSDGDADAAVRQATAA